MTPRRRRFQHALTAVAVALSMVVLAVSVEDLSAATGVTVAIAPTSGDGVIRTGESVRVTWTGMRPGPTYLYQCLDPAVLQRERRTTPNGSCQLNTQVAAMTEPDGTGSADFPVWSSVKAPDVVTAYCSGTADCGIRVSPCVLDYDDDVAGYARLENVQIGEAIDNGDEVIPIEPPKLQRTKPEIFEPAFPAPKPTDKPTVYGAGGTGVDIALQAWAGASIAGDVGVDVTYVPRTIDQGYEALVSGTDSFAAASVPLVNDVIFPYPDLADDQQRAEVDDKRAKAAALVKDLIYVPVIASPLAITYDIAPEGAELDELRLDSHVLARIFGGSSESSGENSPINLWSDPDVQRQQTCTLPDRTTNQGLAFQLQVRAAGRSEVAGSNYLLRSYLTTTQPELTSKFLRPSAAPFRDAVNSAELTGSQALALSLSAHNPQLAVPSSVPTPGRVGYVDAAFAKRFGLKVAQLKNEVGMYALPTSAAAGETLAGAEVDAATGLVDVGFGGASPLAYPLVQVFYVAVPGTLGQGLTAEQSSALREFLTFAVSTAGQDLALAMGYTPLSPAIIEVAKAQIAKLPRAAPTSTTTTPVGTETPTEVASGSDVFSSSDYSGSYDSGASYSSGSGASFDGDLISDTGAALGALMAGEEDDDDGVVAEVRRQLAALAKFAGSPALWALGAVGIAATVGGPLIERRRNQKARAS